MNPREFYLKYKNWFTDYSNDSRGVLGAMDKRAMIPYLSFCNDIHSSTSLPILVEYYHPEKPYFWGNPLEFPYTVEYGPGPDEKPYIIKRGLNWYIVPESAKKFTPLCFTVLKWEFEISLLIFQNSFDNVLYARRANSALDLERLHSLKEMNSFFNQQSLIIDC